MPVAIPDHELLQPIGRGSYGEVWLARSVLGELRAVKLVRHSGAAESGPAGREFAGLRKFEPISRSHEGLVHILHAGRFEGGFYYVMELADTLSEPRDGHPKNSPAELWNPSPAAKPKAPQSTEPNSRKASSYLPHTLRSELRLRRRLPVSECLDLALKLSDALGYLHAQGLVHRDLKPSNIIFVLGQPKLADIGLVASADDSLSCVGTEGYLPPEGPGKPPADLYALGKVLYELATGRDRSDFPELPTLLRDDPDRAALEEFNEVILKACDPDLRCRYQTAMAMHADLTLLSQGKSLLAAGRRRFRWHLARRLALASGLGLAVATSARWLAPGPSPTTSFVSRPQQAIPPSAQVPLFNPLNGHWYQAFPGVLSWDKANDAARSRGGTLATITTAGEQAFIASHFPDACNAGYWLGGRQQPGQSDPASGWSWVTGETWDYTNWLPGAEPGHPNNQGPDEDRLALHGYMGTNPEGFWNDTQRWDAPGFLCEWERATTPGQTAFVGRLPLPPGLKFQSASSSNLALVKDANISVSALPLPPSDSMTDHGSPMKPGLAHEPPFQVEPGAVHMITLLPENGPSGSAIITLRFLDQSGDPFNLNFTFVK